MANSSTLFEHLSIPAPALWGGIVFYIAVVLAIGIFAGRKVRNMSDFIVAGRRLTLLPAIGTLLPFLYRGSKLLLTTKKMLCLFFGNCNIQALLGIFTAAVSYAKILHVENAIIITKYRNLLTKLRSDSLIIKELLKLEFAC